MPVGWSVAMLSPSLPPVEKSSEKSAEKSSLRKNKTLFLRLFLWIKQFLNDRRLPYVANQACRVYFGKEKSGRKKCQSILQTRIELDGQQLQRFLQTSIGDRLLSWLSPLFHFPNQPNAKHGLQQLFVEMAGKPEGISLLQLLNLVPDRTQINLDQLMSTAEKIEDLVQKTELFVGKVQAIAAVQIEPEQVQKFADLPDLRERGTCKVKIFRLDFTTETICYQPEPMPEKMPVIVQSHGLAASPEDFIEYAEYLASYGYFVAVPYHQGSDVNHVKLLLQGEVDEVFPFSEFGDRPIVIKSLLDRLESLNSSQFDGKLNLNSVGIMGHSFGAYTALALAGAKIQFDHLELACDGYPNDPNFSLLLQCQALGLPRQLYHLQDERVACIFTWDFVGSEIFGENGLASVHIPVMAIAGSHDITSPFALEQVRLFQWLQTEFAYLVLMQGKPHVQNLPKLAASVGLKINIFPQFMPTSQPTTFTESIQALSLAFFATHLQQNQDYAPYLSTNYGEYLGRSPHKVSLLTNAAKNQLLAALK